MHVIYLMPSLIATLRALALQSAMETLVLESIEGRRHRYLPRIFEFRKWFLRIANHETEETE